jgi:hypothetical protein
MMEILGYLKIISRSFPRLLTDIEENGQELLSYETYSPNLANPDFHLFEPLKNHLRGHHYESDEAVQEAVRS